MFITTSSACPFDVVVFASNSFQKRISRLRRLLKGGAAAAQRAATAKAPVEADGKVLLEGMPTSPDIPSPPPSGEQRGSRLSSAPAAVATPGTNKSPKQLKSSTFSTRANDMNSRGVQAVMAKLGAVGSELKVERAWAIDDRKPGGGMHEFRASVFNKKLERLFKRCEEAHEEADAVSEAYILL